MNSKNSDNNILAGIIGGLTAAWTNFLLQKNKQELDDDWHFQDIFESFSGAYNWKSEGYRLKYDIDETKIKPKYVNIVRTYDWLYTISVDNEMLNITDSVSPEVIPEIIELNISYTFDEYLNEGMVIFNTPLIWIYSLNTDDYLTIIINEMKIEKYNIHNRDANSESVIDSYLCVDSKEAQNLAIEMKRYYHNYFDRVVIQNTILDKHTPDFFPSLNKFINNLNSIDKYPFNEICKILTETEFYNTKQLLYTLFSITNLLQDDYLINAEKHLEYMLEIDENILESSGILSNINERLIDIYVGLRRERKIKKVINKDFMNNEYKLSRLGRKLTESDQCHTAVYVYEKIVNIEDNYINNFRLFEAYRAINGIISIMELKIKTEAEYPSTGLVKMIDSYLKEENYKWRQANGYTKESKRHKR